MRVGQTMVTLAGSAQQESSAGWRLEGSAGNCTCRSPAPFTVHCFANQKVLTFVDSLLGLRTPQEGDRLKAYSPT